MRRATTLLVLAMLALAAGGCGGSKKSASETTASTTTTTTTESSSTAESSTTTGNTATAPVFASGKCKSLAASAAKINEQTSAATASGNLEDAAKKFQAYVDIAPSEIKGDVQTVADAFKSYAAALKGVNLTAGKTPSAADIQKITTAAKSFSQTKVKAAVQHIRAWVQKNCT